MINLRDPKQYIESFLKIQTKNGSIVPFKLNPAQLKLYGIIQKQRAQKKPVRVIVLKARQLGFSTLTEALIFHSSATYEGVKSYVVAHTEESTSNLFTMTKIYYDNLPEPIQPMKRASNAQEIIFENPTRDAAEKIQRPGLRSKIRCSTAGGKSIARSSTLKNVHLSEYAFWPGDKEATLLGIMQAVPNLPGTMVIIESTANGFDAFKSRWDAAVAGETDFIPVFFAWYENPEYRMAAGDTDWTAAEREIKEQYSLDDEQLAWRRWCIRNNCAGSEDQFKQEYPACADEAFLTSGSPVFDNETIIKRRNEVTEPIKRGEFEFMYDGLAITDIEFVEKANGPISIYTEPEPLNPYVIGGDTAGEGSDFFIGQVLDNITGVQVAVLRHQYDEDLFAQQMYCLGTYYNNALIGIETNYSTFPNKELQRLKYPRLFKRQVEDTTQIRKAIESYGFLTTSVTRPVIIAELVKLMRETPEIVVDFTTLGEMLTFIYNEHRRPEGMSGEHDDCVMALAIAHYIRPQQYFVKAKPEDDRTEEQKMLANAKKAALGGNRRRAKW